MSEHDTVRAWHVAGAHVCSCSRPAPRAVGAFAVEECTTCCRLVLPLDAAAELVGRLMAAGLVAP